MLLAHYQHPTPWQLECSSFFHSFGLFIIYYYIFISFSTSLPENEKLRNLSNCSLFSQLPLKLFSTLNLACKRKEMNWNFWDTKEGIGIICVKLWYLLFYLKIRSLRETLGKPINLEIFIGNSSNLQNSIHSFWLRPKVRWMSFPNSSYSPFKRNKTR